MRRQDGEHHDHHGNDQYHQRVLSERGARLRSSVCQWYPDGHAVVGGQRQQEPTERARNGGSTIAGHDRDGAE